MLLLVGCVRPGSGTDTAVDEAIGRAPTLISFSVSCEPEAALWSIRATADAWTGGADTLWTVDGVYVERHSLPSVSVLADGTGDNLSADYPIVVDWREASDSRTAFLCADDPTLVMQLFDLAGRQVACRFWGANPTIFEQVEDAPDCSGPTGSF